MVVGAFPLVKLGGLLMRQISKPIANFVKERAKHNPYFRTYVCMPPAQFYNWWEIKTKMWILNLGKPVNIPVLSEAMAIELGANMLGEGIVFIIAAGLLIAEYNRGVRKEHAKETARLDDMNNLLARLQEVYLKVEQQDTEIRELRRTVLDNKKGPFGIFGKGDTPSEPPPPTPPPSAWPSSSPTTSTSTQTEPPTQQNIVKLTEFAKLEAHQNINEVPVSLILKAAETLQKDITGNQEPAYRENGIITNALIYIQNEVYCAPLVL